MSLYHETATILTGPSTHGGSLKSRIFGNKDLKSPPAQVYALAFEASKWSAVLKEVVENTQLLQRERKLSPVLSILLTHDLLLSKGGIALPASHGLRASVEKHRVRLQSEFTRARLRRKCPTLDALKAMVDAQLGPAHPRWVRVNAIKSSLDEQLDTTFNGFEIVPTIADVMSPASAGRKLICLDAHVPNLVAASPGTDFTKTSAYKSGAIILQDKASCFPAYLLDPRPEDGDIIDACSAPGNKTTHLAAILHERGFARGQKIFAFEKDKQRAKTLEKMVRTAGSDSVTVIYPGHDFLKTDPNSPEFRNVGALLLDPSCSGSGIVGRDDAPQFHLPGLTNPPSTSSDASNNNNNNSKSRKRKRRADVKQTGPEPKPGPGTDTTEPESEKDLQTRLSALASFQLAMVVHALSFPVAKKVSYSTCSIHAEENEQVVAAALRSDVARRRGWRVLRRDEQVRGMSEWPVRGQPLSSASSSSTSGGEDGMEMDSTALEGCVRAEAGDGMGVMGFFVVCFVRDGVEKDWEGDPDGPFLRDERGRIARDVDGIPFLKSTGERAFALQEDENDGFPMELRFAEDGDGDDGDGPFEKDAQGRIIRNADGMPRLKRHRVEEQEEEEEGGDDDEWGGFDD